MGSYLNPGNAAFRGSLRSQIYIDKTGLIDKLNSMLGTEQKYVCVSRPRRFGKSMAANMLAAYYDRDTDSSELFDRLKISKSPSYLGNRNQYDVLKVNMQKFLSATYSMNEMIEKLNRYLRFDLLNRYTEVQFMDENDLIQVMKDVYAYTHHQFIILIDEWDCLFANMSRTERLRRNILIFFVSG